MSDISKINTHSIKDSTARANHDALVEEINELVDSLNDALDAKLDTSGGTLTGNLTGKYITGTWLQTTASTELDSSSYRIPVLDGSGWIYHRTKENFKNDLKVPTITQTLTSGTEIGAVTVGDTTTKLYAPVGESGGGVADSVSNKLCLDTCSVDGSLHGTTIYDGSNMVYIGTGFNLSEGQTSKILKTAYEAFCDGDGNVISKSYMKTGSVEVTPIAGTGELVAKIKVGDVTQELYAPKITSVGAIYQTLKNNTNDAHYLLYNSSNTTGVGEVFKSKDIKVYPRSGSLSAMSLKENDTPLSQLYLGIMDKASDSDKLDGNDSAYYLNYNNFSNTPSIPSSTSDITNDSGFITKSVSDLTNYTDKTETATDLAVTIDNNTYVMTLSLKNEAGDVISTGSVDLPLETMVVGASYANGKLTLTLKNGTTTQVDVSSLVSGLVSTQTLNTTLTNYVPATRTINGKALSSNITLLASDVGLGNVNNTADSAKSVASAAKLTTARKISLYGDVSGSVDFDGSAPAIITTTVADDSHNHIIGNIDGLQTALDKKVDSMQYEWARGINFGSTGKLYVGRFKVYDSNIVIDFSCTASTTYSGKLVIATQNGQIRGLNVYGDASNTVAPNIYILQEGITSNRQWLQVYFNPASWSKNIIHIRAQAIDECDLTVLCSNVASIPETATTKPNNVLANTFLGASAKAADSNKLDGQDSSYYATQASVDGLYTADKISCIDLYGGTNEIYLNNEGIYWAQSSAEIEINDGEYYKGIRTSINVPIVAGDNITFEVDTTNNVVKVNATASGGIEVIDLRG